MQSGGPSHREERAGLLGKEDEDSLNESSVESQYSHQQESISGRIRHAFLGSSKAPLYRPPPRTWLDYLSKTCSVILVVVIGILALFGLFELLFGPVTVFWRHDDAYDAPSWWPEWGEEGQPGEYVKNYPTDLTRDIVPLPCASHNDEWRRIPLFDALHYGCTGVEADVWLHNDNLFVGHSPVSLSKNRTFLSLYVNPIVKILDTMNPNTSFATSTRNGVFDEDPQRSLILLVDFKNNGRALYTLLKEQLQPLREKNYLTVFNGSTLVQGPVTVVGTGNTPFDLVEADTFREVFFDAPIGIMGVDPATARNLLLEAGEDFQGINGVDPAAGAAQFTSGNSFYASTDFQSSIGFPWRGHLTDSQLDKLRKQIKAAHDQGLKVRYWNTPSWPIGLRNRVWETLVREGVDYLNVDDLYGASRVAWG